jgi:hypothetical protein
MKNTFRMGEAFLYPMRLRTLVWMTTESTMIKP